MKARIKATGEIVRLISSSEYTSLVENSIGAQIIFVNDDLEVINDMKQNESSHIDWEERRFELVKAAMQGVLARWTAGTPTSDVLARQTFHYADAVLAEYRKGGEEQ